MIGGRVLDTSALVAFATETSVYCAALVWTAVKESIVLAVPSTAVAEAWTVLDGDKYPILDVLLSLHVTVIDSLDGERARTVGRLGGPQTDAHAIVCARQRGWPLVTGESTRYRSQGHAGVEIETLP
ncbi:MAG TPA: type II toxin-antitoxin system VapC family toxin [Pseudonocardiaceae bacterium]|nr:type II toxin-antitoxin system VapC family toxin [Pseudonocardiaceae bacterium]